MGESKKGRDCSHNAALIQPAVGGSISLKKSRKTGAEERKASRGEFA